MTSRVHPGADARLLVHSNAAVGLIQDVGLRSTGGLCV